MIEVFSPSQGDEVVDRVDGSHVLAFAEGHPEAAPLADGVRGRSPVLADHGSVGVDQRPRRGSPVGAPLQVLAVVAIPHEADLLALGLVGGGQSMSTCHRASLGLGQLAEGKPCVGQLSLPQAVQEIGLVLVGVTAGNESVAMAIASIGIMTDLDARVVTGGHSLTAVEVTGTAQQGSELDRGVAVNARAGRASVEVRCEERLQHASGELALQVQDVERDAQLSRDPTRILGGIERAAGTVGAAVGVGGVVQPHPDPDHVHALLHQQRGRR